MEMKASHVLKVSVVAVVLAGLCALCVGCNGSGNAQKETTPSLINEVTGEQGIVYTIYIGMADKDTGKDELTMQQAKDKLVPLFAEAGSGFTMVEGYGGYMDEEGTMIENGTLVLMGVHGEEQAIIDIIGKTKEVLNVASVYCESNLTGYGIFGGVTSEIG